MEGKQRISLGALLLLVLALAASLSFLASSPGVEQTQAGVNSWTFCGKADPYRTYSVKNRVGCKKAKKLIKRYLRRGTVPKPWFVKSAGNGENAGPEFKIIHPRRPAEILVYFRGEGRG